jgi:hypothetical protein
MPKYHEEEALRGLFLLDYGKDQNNVERLKWKVERTSAKRAEINPRL